MELVEEVFESAKGDRSEIAVVIPFYQRKSGLLRRALISIFAQDSETPLEILVVDDESPVSCLEEIQGLEPPRHISIRVYRQRNRGAGVARNTALERISPTVRYVAFLDSDDVWISSHIRTAEMAMGAGADFYFSDRREMGGVETSFEKAGFFESANLLCAKSERGAIEIGSGFAYLALRGFISTPTVVYRRTACEECRFPVDFYRFGEDQYFWLKFFSRPIRVFVSPVCEVECGRGVSIYSDQVFGTEKTIMRLRDEVAFRLFVIRTLSIEQDASDYNQLSLLRARLNLITNILHQFRRLRFKVGARVLKEYPFLWGDMLRALIKNKVQLGR